MPRKNVTVEDVKQAISDGKLPTIVILHDIEDFYWDGDKIAIKQKPAKGKFGEDDPLSLIVK